MSQTIIVTFSPGQTEAVAGTALEQWAYGQRLQFAGLNLPAAYQVDFSNFEFCGDSIPRIGGADGVDVPVEVLTSGLSVYAFVWIQTQDAGRRQYRAMIRVIPGPLPSPEEPNPEEESVIGGLIASLNDAVEAAESAEENAQASETAAAGSAAEAAGSAVLAESWAVGGTGTRDGEDQNNAKFWAEEAGNAATEAEAAAAAAAESETGAGSAASVAAASATAAATAQTAAETAQGKAEDAQEAAEDAQAAAAQSATNAATAENNASTKAGEAAQSATSASGSAATATQKASEASASATAAAGSATSAGSAANAAASSATAAGNAQTAAETAQDKAEDAQEAAETAQNAAETAAASVAGSAAQIAQNTEDIVDLKSALTLKVDKDLMQKCELVHQEASPNVFDKNTVSDGLLHTNGTVYTGGSYDNYCYNNIGAVNEGDVISSYFGSANIATNTMQRVVAYDSSGNVLANSGGVQVASYTVPSGVASVKVTFNKNQIDAAMVFINAESAPTGYIPFSPEADYYVATKEFIPAQAVDNKVDVDGENQVTTKNSIFMYASPNLLDTSKMFDGYYINQLNGLMQENSVYSASDYIKVYAGINYTFSRPITYYGISFRYAVYTAEKVYISGENINIDGAHEKTILTPSNAAYIRFSIGINSKYVYQFEKGSVATQYFPYGGGYLLPEYAPRSEQAILNLPSKIYALVGYELNIYFENITEDWETYKWDVISSWGRQYERGFKITPEETSVGSYTLTIIATAPDGTESTASTELEIISASAGSGITKSVMILGDSTTNNGIAVTKLNENFSTDPMNITTLGTRGTAPNNHEGRSGWRFSSYFAPPNAGDIAAEVENPWYNPTTETFDANYYFTTTEIVKPDWFFINLGINDMFSYTTDASAEEQINSCKTLCNEMIESMNSASPNTKIGICLTIPPNHSQDAFAKAYGCAQTRDRYKRNNLLWVNALIDEYDGRENEGIYIVPIFTNLDTIYNMGMETIPVNARNTSTTYSSPIGNGGVHPVESGYWQIADVYTAFLKANA